MLKKLLIAAAVAGFASSAALADHLVTVTWTGKITSGADTFGAFGGGDMTDADFTSVYVFDVTTAQYQLGTVTFSDPDSVYPFFSDYSNGLLSASFTANGQTVSVGGNEYNDLYAYHDPNQFFPSDKSQFMTSTQNADGDNLAIMTQQASLSTDEPWADLDILDYDGDVSNASPDGQANFFALANFQTQQIEQLFLKNQHLTIVNSEAVVAHPSVPEPASWALMVAGFGLAGAAMRRRRTIVRFA